MEIYLLVAVVFFALAFDFINGFHDTANAIATSISTRALKPRVAVALAAVMNFVGAVAFTGVAKMIGGGVADPATLEHGIPIVISALIGAIAWNVITWWYGIPSSSSHALIGALPGAVISGAGMSSLSGAGTADMFKALFLSPVLAFTIGSIIRWLFQIICANMNPHSINTGFRFGQMITASAQAFSRCTKNAQ